eukprot:759811-Hanusia_phi.AAC.2
MHPYPSDVVVEMLSQKTGLSTSQVSYWFVNARRRIWQPMLQQKRSSSLTGYAKVTATEDGDGDTDSDGQLIEVDEEKNKTKSSDEDQSVEAPVDSSMRLIELKEAELNKFQFSRFDSWFDKNFEITGIVSDSVGDVLLQYSRMDRSVGLDSLKEWLTKKGVTLRKRSGDGALVCCGIKRKLDRPLFMEETKPLGIKRRKVVQVSTSSAGKLPGIKDLLNSDSSRGGDKGLADQCTMLQNELLELSKAGQQALVADAYPFKDIMDSKAVRVHATPCVADMQQTLPKSNNSQFATLLQQMTNSHQYPQFQQPVSTVVGHERSPAALPINAINPYVIPLMGGNMFASMQSSPAANEYISNALQNTVTNLVGYLSSQNTTSSIDERTYLLDLLTKARKMSSSKTAKFQAKEMEEAAQILNRTSSSNGKASNQAVSCSNNTVSESISSEEIVRITYNGSTRKWKGVKSFEDLEVRCHNTFGKGSYVLRYKDDDDTMIDVTTEDEFRDYVACQGGGVLCLELADKPDEAVPTCEQKEQGSSED